MITYHLTGRIDPDGKLQVELPPDAPPGDVEVVITISDSIDKDSGWTDDEIRRMTRVSAKTGAEIAAMLKEMDAGFQHIQDSAAWVDEQRRKLSEDARW